MLWRARDGGRHLARSSELPILGALAGLTCMVFGFVAGLFGWWTGALLLGAAGLLPALAVSLLWLSPWELLAIVGPERPTGSDGSGSGQEKAAPPRPAAREPAAAMADPQPAPHATAAIAAQARSRTSARTGPPRASDG